MTTDNWLEVCATKDLPKNGLIPKVINGIELLIVNGTEKRIVISKSCPHMEASLEEAVFDGDRLTCTKHLWQWSVTEGGAPEGEAEAPLLCYETKEENGILWVRVSEELKYDYQK